MRVAATWAMAILLFTGCTSPGMECDLNTTDYAIYSTVINKQLLPSLNFRDKQSGYVFVRGITTANPSIGVLSEGKYEAVGKVLPGISRETYDDFMAANKIPLQLEKRLELQVAYRFAQDHDVWDPTYNSSSYGLITLSKIGFNHLGNEAMVYVCISALSKSGRGSILLLRKHGSNWIVQQVHEVWIS
jgi:hypothetical protein